MHLWGACKKQTSKNQIRDEESGSILQSPFHSSNIAVKRLFATYNLINWIEFLWQTIIFAVNENLFTLWKSARIIHSHCCRCHLRSVASVSRHTPWTKIWVTCHWICTWSISRLQAINRTPFQLQLISWVVHNWQLKVLSLESSEDSNKPWIEAKGSKRKELLRLKWQLSEALQESSKDGRWFEFAAAEQIKPRVHLWKIFESPGSWCVAFVQFTQPKLQCRHTY